MTHPLTDGMIEDIVYENIYSDETVRTGGLGVPRYHDGRVMLRYADMRAAADWQLERDAEYWTIVLNRMRILHPRAADSIIEEFKQAMRPQEDN